MLATQMRYPRVIRMEECQSADRIINFSINFDNLAPRPKKFKSNASSNVFIADKKAIVKLPLHEYLAGIGDARIRRHKIS